MKNFKLKIYFGCAAVLISALSACGPSVSTKSADTEFNLTGEMLFEGANTLQYSPGSALSDIATNAGLQRDEIQDVKVSGAVIEMDETSKRIAESLLLQIVSDNQELVTIGTLSPLPENGKLELSLAEDTSIMPYLRDTGTTWVLDLNISEDHMDELAVLAKLALSVDYQVLNN